LNLERKRTRLKKRLESHQLDAVLLLSLENIRYLSGFTGSDAVFLLTQKEAFFLTDSRYWTQAEDEVRDAQIVRYQKKTDGLVSLLLDLKSKRVGFESSSLPFSLYQTLLEKLEGRIEFVPLEKELRNLRAFKDETELSLIRSAIGIASEAFLHVLKLIKEGAEERVLSLEMEFFMKRRGAEATGFDIIVASGARSALPHGRASDKRIEKGDFVLIDFGSRFKGYHSDQTRTLFCHSSTSEQRKIYDIVKEAHDRAIAKIRPGIPISEVDRVAREFIRTQGYGEYFGHGTGHGIGLAVHEDPVVNGENQDPLQEGMVFTIEPGIYLPGWGGVRIEDMVRVTADGAEVLTYLSTELQEI
jgi:Xaa-Pro aminopeptidase